MFLAQCFIGLFESVKRIFAKFIRSIYANSSPDSAVGKMLSVLVSYPMVNCASHASPKKTVTRPYSFMFSEEALGRLRS